ncbi:MAG: hypothetical protein ACI8TP_004020 [Acidimicrobiales bacterium]|jgi:uncharacterized protein (DUF58 family)
MSAPTIHSHPFTRAGLTVAGLGTAAYVAGWQFGWLELMVLAAASLVALALAVPFVIGRQRLLVERSLRPERVTVGEPAMAVLTVTNPAKAPIGNRAIEDHVNGEPVAINISGLAPDETIEVFHPLPTERRGVFEIGPAVIAKADPLGLMRREVRQAGVDQLWVHPRVTALNVVPVGFAKDLEGPTSDASPAGDVSFHTLREYEIGDDHRHVHWLSTARTGTLMVRHYVDNRLPHLTVVLDNNAAIYEQENFETAVEVAASLTVTTMLHQQPVALRVGDQAILGSTQPASTERVLDALTTVDANETNQPGEMLATACRVEPDTSALVLVTGPRSGSDLLALTQRVSRQAHCFIVRVWPDGDAIEPAVVPGATVFDAASLDQFRVAWNRVMA